MAVCLVAWLAAWFAVWLGGTAGTAVAAQLQLPSLPGSSPLAGYKLYTDGELGFAISLAPGWTAQGVAGAAARTDAPETARLFAQVLPTDDSSGSDGVWLVVIRLSGQKDGVVPGPLLQELADWLAGQYGEWQWIEPRIVGAVQAPAQAQSSPSVQAQDLAAAPAQTPTMAGVNVGGTAWVAHWTGTGTDAGQRAVEVQLWIVLGTEREGFFYVLVAGGPQSRFKKEESSVINMVRSFRPLATGGQTSTFPAVVSPANPPPGTVRTEPPLGASQAETPAGVSLASPPSGPTQAEAPGGASPANPPSGTVQARSPAGDSQASVGDGGTSLLNEFRWADQGIIFKQPAGWRVQTAVSGSERAVKMASTGGEAVVQLHVLPIQAAASSLDERSSLVARFGTVYLSQLGQAVVAGGQGLANFRVQVSGLSKQTPGQFEALYTYDDPQAGPAAGWVIIRLVDIAPAGASNGVPAGSQGKEAAGSGSTGGSAGEAGSRADSAAAVGTQMLVLMDSQAVADVFQWLYPTYRAIWESVQIQDLPAGNLGN